jgi:TetR/AcrR family transcriptional regulator, transcriptional repressor for nem operon
VSTTDDVEPTGMGSSQIEKAASHERIVAIAAARIRMDGIDGLGVADVMGEAGLTHGGFYRHFDSREDLVTEALALALREGSERTRTAADALGSRALRVIINAYLSQEHRDTPATGCAVAALAEDVSRANTAARQLYARQVDDYVDLLNGLEPISDRPDSRLAVLTLSTLVGALSIARAIGDDAQSREFLQEAANALKELLGV